MDCYDIDCFVIGNNQMEFGQYVSTLRRMGSASGAFRDVSLSFYEERGVIRSCADFFNDYYRKSSEAQMSYDNLFSATVAYLCTYLFRNGHSFDYVNSYREGRDHLIDTLTHKRVRAVVITTTYYVFSLPIMEIVKTVKTYAPDVRIIIGGPFLHTQSKIHDKESFEFLLDQLRADFYVIGAQGERTLADILGVLKNGASEEGLQNCIRKRGSGYLYSPEVPENNDLKQNLVDWSLFAKDVGIGRRRMVMTRTAISCPFACSFCGFPARAGAYRYLDASDVCTELDQLQAVDGINSVTFIDDTFNVPLTRYREILEILAEKRYGFRWNCNFRAQHADEECIALMKAAGCEGVFLGLESGSDRILRNMNKKSHVEAYRRGVDLLRRHGIITYASFIVGYPGETTETIKETIDFIETARPDFFRAQLWYYDTTTPITKEAAKYDLRNSQFEWSHDTMNAAEAADWVEYMHRSIRGSTWLPQNDFDYPSLFNLLSRGWSLTQIKEMLESFNERVRGRLAVEQTLRVGGVRASDSRNMRADSHKVVHG